MTPEQLFCTAVLKHVILKFSNQGSGHQGPLLCPSPIPHCTCHIWPLLHVVDLWATRHSWKSPGSRVGPWRPNKTTWGGTSNWGRPRPHLRNYISWLPWEVVEERKVSASLLKLLTPPKPKPKPKPNPTTQKESTNKCQTWSCLVIWLNGHIFREVPKKLRKKLQCYSSNCNFI